MNEEVLIQDMKCFCFRIAEKRWNKSPKETFELFQKYNLLKYIDDCFGILHVSSYECIVDDMEKILKNNGVRIYA